MSVTDNKMDQNAEVAVEEIVHGFVSATGQTNLATLIAQFSRKAMRVTGVDVFATAVTATIALDVGIVQPGEKLDAGALGVSADTFKLKLTGPVRFVAPDGTYKNKATEDNHAFTQVAAANPTINVGAVAGQWWGAARIQIASDGTISTKVCKADQAFATEQNAVDALPIADADKVDVGYVTVRTKAGVSFTFNVGVITGAGAGANDAATVNWTNTASGFESVLTGAITPVATDPVKGVMSSTFRKLIVKKGGLLVSRYTSDGTGAVTNVSVRIGRRPFPLDGEVFTQITNT